MQPFKHYLEDIILPVSVLPQPATKVDSCGQALQQLAEQASGREIG